MTKEKPAGSTNAHDAAILHGGDERGFGELVAEYTDRLYGFAVRMLGDGDSAADAVQETFVRAWRKRRSYDPSYPLSTWLFTICANLSRTELRRRNRWRTVPIDSLSVEATESYEPSDGSGTLIARVEAALPELPPKYRLAFVLRDMQGLSYADVARSMDVPLGTVKSRVNRARLMMREILAPFVREEADEVLERASVPE
jgi:RNA polymerase sigma-70 factor (ECF subfamily)